MHLMQRIIDLERRMTRQESNRGASLRYGTVTESNTAGSARVQLHDGDGMVTHAVRTLHRRTLKDQDQCLPDLGEQVAVLFAGQGMEEGCVLGAMYSQKDAAPGQDQPVQFYRFEDGTVIAYDRANHRFFVDIKGEAEIIVKENASVTVKKDATVKVEGAATVDVTKDATVRSNQRLILEGHAGVWMRGPSIIFEGIEGKPCKAAINADIFIKGLVDHHGNLIQSGDQNVDGSVSTSGNMQAGGDVRAAGVVQGNPVIGCPH